MVATILRGIKWYWYHCGKTSCRFDPTLLFGLCMDLVYLVIGRRATYAAEYVLHIYIYNIYIYIVWPWSGMKGNYLTVKCHFFEVFTFSHCLIAQRNCQSQWGQNRYPEGVLSFLKYHVPLPSLPLFAASSLIFLTFSLNCRCQKNMPTDTTFTPTAATQICNAFM